MISSVLSIRSKSKHFYVLARDTRDKVDPYKLGHFSTVERLGANPNLQKLTSRDVSTWEAIKSLGSWFNELKGRSNIGNLTLIVSLKAHNIIHLALNSPLK